MKGYSQLDILFTGGCFTQQHNIPFPNLYHQTLSRSLNSDGINTAIRTLRYERWDNLIEKLNLEYDTNKIQLLGFHLRTEPLMRRCKIYYKYKDANGKLRYSINTKWNRSTRPEAYDILNHTSDQNLNRNYADSFSESFIYKGLRELNYILGDLSGNKDYALRKNLELINKIKHWCEEREIYLLLIGPASRPFSRYEDRLSVTIHNFFKKHARDMSIDYLSIIGKSTIMDQAMFFNNGIYISQEGHDEIARLLKEKITSISGKNV
jgi:hypothetical protein